MVLVNKVAQMLCSEFFSPPEDTSVCLDSLFVIALDYSEQSQIAIITTCNICYVNYILPTETNQPPKLAYLVYWLLSDFWKSLNIVSLNRDKERDDTS